MATRYQTVRARLTDFELAALRKLPGGSDSERLREAIQRASGGDKQVAALAVAAVADEAQTRGDKLVAAVGKLVVEKVERMLEKQRDEVGKIAGQAAADRIRPVIVQLNKTLGGGKNA